MVHLASRIEKYIYGTKSPHRSPDVSKRFIKSLPPILYHPLIIDEPTLFNLRFIYAPPGKLRDIITNGLFPAI